MKKLIDFDALFDEKLSEYMQLNAGKYSEKQWESIIPKLYRQFGDIHISSVGNTPKGYYAEMTDAELADQLRRHVEEGVPVSDFLCRELEGRDCPDALVELLGSKDEELLLLAVNVAGANVRAFDAYFKILRSSEDTELKDAVTEQLKGNADAAKEQALKMYGEGIEPDLMLEILSRTKERDDRVYSLLLDAFKTSGEIPMHASYLAAYGDVRALPVLAEVIDRDDINYLEFQELKFAIEALGGEYTRERDWSSDPYYREIHGED